MLKPGFKVMVLGGEAFRRQTGHEVIAPINKSHKKRPQKELLLLLPREVKQEDGCL